MKKCIALLSFTFLALSGCANTRVSDCKQLFDVIKRTNESETAQPSGSPGSLRASADKNDQEIQMFEAISINDGKLKSLRSDYVNERRRVSQAYRDMASSFEANVSQVRGGAVPESTLKEMSEKSNSYVQSSKEANAKAIDSLIKIGVYCDSK